MLEEGESVFFKTRSTIIQEEDTQLGVKIVDLGVIRGGDEYNTVENYQIT